MSAARIHPLRMKKIENTVSNTGKLPMIASIDSKIAYQLVMVKIAILRFECYNISQFLAYFIHFYGDTMSNHIVGLIRSLILNQTSIQSVFAVVAVVLGGDVYPPAN